MNNKPNPIKGDTTMKRKAENNRTIDLTKARFSKIDEIDEVIKTLTVYDLIDACDIIRMNGVTYFDYDKEEEVNVPLDMEKIQKVTKCPYYTSLESVCANWFARLLGGVKNHQAYEDFVYWYNCHAEILKAEVADGNTPTVPYSDIKYLALEDTVNSMCEALMTA